MKVELKSAYYDGTTMCFCPEQQLIGTVDNNHCFGCEYKDYFMSKRSEALEEFHKESDRYRKLCEWIEKQSK